MIEALIAYIEDQGFDVHVFPSVLCIRKAVDDKLWGYDWAISRLDLEMARTSKELLFRDADYRLAQLRKAIKENSVSHEDLAHP